jgi:DivIVA domain-containing protein
MSDVGRHREEQEYGATAVGVYRIASRLTRLRPEQVRTVRFRRTRVGRRGLAEEQVYGFVRRMVDELTIRDAAEAGLREENARLKRALRDWQQRFAPRPGQLRNTGRWARPEQRG